MIRVLEIQGFTGYMAIMGKNIDYQTVTRLSARLNEELPLPYFFDIVDFTHLSHLKLAEHIKKYGRPIYTRNEI